MKKEIAIVGLGKMGDNLRLRLEEKGWTVFGYDQNQEVTDSKSLAQLAARMTPPRIFWLLVPAGKAVDETIDELLKHTSKGDFIADSGNSFYKDSARRAEYLKPKGIRFLDVGISGGPGGARNGACLMIGGEQENFDALESLFRDVAREDAVRFFPGAGAGHFVKMVHNSIEYGMMQSLAEGFTILKQSPYRLDLKKVAEIHNRGSCIESRLVGWLRDAIEKYGPDFEGVSGAVGHTGEGEWTVKVAKEMGVKIKVLEEAYQFRVDSAKKPSWTGKILSALRNTFGGHSVK